MTLEQMSVKYLTAFEAYYGPDTQMGRALTLAQQEQFLNEGMGVPITQQLLDSTQSQNDQNVYPHLFQNTTDTEYREACFVRISTSCLFGDLDRYRLGDKEPSNQYGSGYSLGITPQCSTEMF